MPFRVARKSLVQVPNEAKLQRDRPAPSQNSHRIPYG